MLGEVTSATACLVAVEELERLLGELCGSSASPHRKLSGSGRKMTTKPFAEVEYPSLVV
jgi:hypothetical protein